MFYDYTGVAFNHDHSQNSYQGNPSCTLELWTTHPTSIMHGVLQAWVVPTLPKDDSYPQILLLHMNITFMDNQCTSRMITQQ